MSSKHDGDEADEILSGLGKLLADLANGLATEIDQQAAQAPRAKAGYAAPKAETKPGEQRKAVDPGRTSNPSPMHTTKAGDEVYDILTMPIFSEEPSGPEFTSALTRFAGRVNSYIRRRKAEGYSVYFNGGIEVQWFNRVAVVFQAVTVTKDLDLTALKEMIDLGGFTED